MAQHNNIAWKPIMYCIGTGVLGIALGTYMVAPMVQKMAAKKNAKQKKKALTSPKKV